MSRRREGAGPARGGGGDQGQAGASSAARRLTDVERDPAALSTTARLTEVAELLATGYVRSRLAHRRGESARVGSSEEQVPEVQSNTERAQRATDAPTGANPERNAGVRLKHDSRRARTAGIDLLDGAMQSVHAPTG